MYKDHKQITAANKIWTEAHLLCSTINSTWQLVNQNQAFTDFTNQEHIHVNDDNKKQVFCQKGFSVKEENTFNSLLKDIHTLIKNLNSYTNTCKLIISSLQDNNQVYRQSSLQNGNQVDEQESVIISSNEYSIDIVNDNQDLILYKA
ncbi:11482_t:CDS:2 [Dentiscutata erythropus]|uniref:11482_t:CDS:1 n=1 Tax=Dentiscutata erythropus TaxID=1348616 RepID=A0A9N9JLB0_9GLOM|nr:11482_t:CDS:2 [Dentiscutata erythropus]